MAVEEKKKENSFIFRGGREQKLSHALTCLIWFLELIHCLEQFAYGSVKHVHDEAPIKASGLYYWNIKLRYLVNTRNVTACMTTDKLNKPAKEEIIKNA